MSDSTPPPPSPEQPSGAQPLGAAAPLSDSDARLWASLAHAGTILFTFLPGLIIWLIYRERSTFVEKESKEALNFGILLTIVYIAGGILIPVFGLGLLVDFAAFVASLVFCIQAAMKANKGESYSYPFSLRLVK